jgi:lipopolysaccharide/colanic/teichoic acid biosynthesis glycosyltransferase
VSSYYGELYVGKIGLTGLWFVENLYVSDEEEMKSLDLFYAKNQSIWLDLEIWDELFQKFF